MKKYSALLQLSPKWMTYIILSHTFKKVTCNAFQKLLIFQ